MPKELKDVNVDFISLVDKGANQKIFIYKSASGESPTLQRTVPIVKTDVVKHMVYGVVYSPLEVDSQDDFMTAPEIEKMAYAFMKARKTDKVDKQHDTDPDEGFVAESWIVRKDDPLFPEEAVGAWVVGIKVTNDETWAQVESGEITGLSMGGFAKRIDTPENTPQEKQEKGLMKRMANFFKSGKTDVAKDFNSQFQLDSIRRATWSLQDALLEILNDDEVVDKKAALQNSVNQFSNFIEGGFTVEKNKGKTPEEIKKEQENSAAPENTPETEGVEKLQESIDTLTETVTKLVWIPVTTRMVFKIPFCSLARSINSSAF